MIGLLLSLLLVDANPCDGPVQPLAPFIEGRNLDSLFKEFNFTPTTPIEEITKGLINDEISVTFMFLVINDNLVWTMDGGDGCNSFRGVHYFNENDQLVAHPTCATQECLCQGGDAGRCDLAKCEAQATCSGLAGSTCHWVDVKTGACGVMGYTMLFGLLLRRMR